MKKGQRKKGGGKNKKKRPNNKSSPNNASLPKCRFEYGDRVDCLCRDVWETGTVVNVVADPYKYKILLENGEVIQTDHATSVRKSDSPPIQIEYPKGTRIECRLGRKSEDLWGLGESWRLGEIIQTDKDWAKNESFPYTIKFDEEEENRHFIGPKDMIRRAPLRFGVGDRVEVKMWWEGPDVSKLGTIAELWPKRDARCTYAVRHDDGHLTLTRYDVDWQIVSSDIPPVPVASFLEGDRVEFKEEEMWRRGTVLQSNLDWVERNCAPFFIRCYNGECKVIYGTNIRACDSDPFIPISKALERLGLSDNESLFETPPPMPDCPICFLPLPIEDSECKNKVCCGATICVGCHYAHLYTRGVDETCPFCRAPEDRSDKETVRLLRERAKLNDAEIVFNLGYNYQIGRFGLPVDLQKAHELYVRAADLGSPRACTNAALGFEYRKDKEKQMYYLEKGAKLGQVKARHFLGEEAARKKAWDLALRHWKISASAGFQPSLEQLKTGYKVGMLSKKDLIECLRANQKSLSEEWSEDRSEAADFLSRYS